MRNCAQNPALSVGDLLSFLECDCIAMLIRGYIDDSSDQKQEQIAVAGLFVGDSKQWTRLTRPWRKLLRQHGLEYFKYSQCKSRNGQFHRFRDKAEYSNQDGIEAAAAIGAEFEAIIANSGIKGMAHCIPLKMYKGMRKNNELAAHVFPADPFVAVLQSVIRDCALSFKKHYGDKHKLSFMCDEGSNAPRILEAYTAFKQLHPDFQHLIGALGFGDDKKYPQLQAADLMAGVGKEIALTGAREHRLSSSIHFVRYWSEQNMLDTLQSQLDSVPLRRATGMIK